MNGFYHFDQTFIEFCRRYYSLIARAALFVIFFYFGLLKLIGASPASELATGFASKMGFASVAHELYIALAVVECLIGLALLVPRFTRPAIFVMLAHMVVVSLPLLFYPEAAWTAPLVPSLEGQYIIKNAALVALALGLVATTKATDHCEKTLTATPVIRYN